MINAGIVHHLPQLHLRARRRACGTDLRTRRLRVVAPTPATDRDHAHEQHPDRHRIVLLVTGRSELLPCRNP